MTVKALSLQDILDLDQNVLSDKARGILKGPDSALKTQMTEAARLLVAYSTDAARKNEEGYTEAGALTGESLILDLLEAKDFKSPAKLIKFCRNLMAVTKSEVQVRLLEDICLDISPIKYLKKTTAKVRDCAIIVQQFIEDGCHGMIMIKDDVYPVTLETRITTTWLTDGKPWDPTDEMELQHHAADAWMKQHDKGRFLGKVILFPQFGFSGVPRIVEMQCTPDVKGLTRYPGTNFYYEKKGA